MIALARGKCKKRGAERYVGGAPHDAATIVLQIVARALGFQVGNGETLLTDVSDAQEVVELISKNRVPQTDIDESVFERIR